MRHTYRRSAVRTKKSSGIHPVWIGIFAFLIVVIVILISVLVKRHPEDVTVTDGLAQDSQEVATDVSDSSASNSADATTDSASPLFEETDLYFVGDGYAGFARRGIEDGIFTAAVVTSMPSIDLATHYYEVWLVKPGITGYFSAGEMFARADGKFGLVYEMDVNKAPADVLDYSDIVITREIRDNDLSPSPTHIVEGGF